MNCDESVGENERIGVSFGKRRLFCRPEFQLFIGDRVVVAAATTKLLGPLCMEWKWLDGTAIRLEYGDVTSPIKLYGDDELAYEIPHFGFEKGGHKYVWRRTADKTPVVTAVVMHQLFKYREYHFRGQTGDWMASLNQKCLFGWHKPKHQPAPVSGFQGSLEELNLIWGFILAYECGTDASR